MDKNPKINIKAEENGSLSKLTHSQVKQKGKKKIQKKNTPFQKKKKVDWTEKAQAKKPNFIKTIYTETSSQAPCRQSVKNKIAWFKPINSNPILLEYV